MIHSGLRSMRWAWGSLHHPSISRYVLDIPISEITTSKRNFTSSCTAKGRAPDSLLRLKSLVSENDHSLARTWLEGFGPEDIPKEAWSASYSRSSGPGGQVSPCFRFHSTPPPFQSHSTATFSKLAYFHNALLFLVDQQRAMGQS